MINAPHAETVMFVTACICATIFPFKILMLLGQECDRFLQDDVLVRVWGRCGPSLHNGFSPHLCMLVSFIMHCYWASMYLGSKYLLSRTPLLWSATCVNAFAYTKALLEGTCFYPTPGSRTPTPFIWSCATFLTFKIVNLSHVMTRINRAIIDILRMYPIAATTFLCFGHRPSKTVPGLISQYFDGISPCRWSNCMYYC